MPPGGWGRRAAGKIDRKLEDDILFKEIGGQLEASNFDYSQWQRSGRSPTRAATGRRPPPPAPKRDALSALDRPVTGKYIMSVWEWEKEGITKDKVTFLMKA